MFVRAAHFDRLEAITWTFPFVGTVPYLGFFNKEDRDAEAKELKSQGYDIATFGVDAFSSLGWFSDPLYSTMLDEPVEYLSDTIFHELTHRTLWINGEADFNENLATFVGGYLSEQYLISIAKQDRIERMRKVEADHKLYIAWLSELKKSLNELYERKLAAEALRHEKAEIFRSFTKDKKPSFQLVDYIGKREWNNATVLGASMYEPDLKRFSRAYECFANIEHGNIGAFLPKLSEKTKTIKDPLLALDSFCGA